MSSYQEDIDYEGNQNHYQQGVDDDQHGIDGNDGHNTYSDMDNQYDNMKRNQKPNYNNNKNNKHKEQSQSAHSQQQQSSSSQNSHEQQPSQEIQMTEEEKLQQEIMSAVVEMEQSTPYQNELTAELFDKLKGFHTLSHMKHGEELVTLRIQQLVVNKVLVLTYGKHEFRLILAHYHLGQAYLANQCIQQSIQHISLALHKIEKLFDSVPQTRLLQTYIQNQLAKALIEKENYQDAIELLNESIKIQTQLKSQRKKQQSDSQQSNTKNTHALVLLSQCYAKINQYDQSIKVIDEVISITRKKKMAKEQYAFALVQKAKILALQKNFINAIANQQQAIDILMEENYSKPEEVAELYTVLSSYHEEIGSVENSLTCIQKVKTLYQELYSAQDKRVIKARRKIATFLLKSQRFKEAVNQLLEVVELQQKVFGENSLQTARTLKLLGAVYISMQVADARAYLKRAMNIFQSHGNKKQVQQIRDKLKMLYNGAQNQNKDVRLTGSEHQI